MSEFPPLMGIFMKCLGLTPIQNVLEKVISNVLISIIAGSRTIRQIRVSQYDAAGCCSPIHRREDLKCIKKPSPGGWPTA
jgi:hypothetical protein